jgi:hypothetical protein
VKQQACSSNDPRAEPPRALGRDAGAAARYFEFEFERDWF